MKKFAERFKEALDARGMKQSEIVSLTKIGKSSISTYLSGEYEPKQRNIYKIATALNVDESWLMGHDVPMERKQRPPLPPEAIPYVRGRRIPILGSIPAGVPVLTVEEYDEYDYAYVPEGEDYFFLRVRGDSMINAGINTGDLVLIKVQPCADNGNVVACRVNGDEATLKRFYKNGGVVVLQPENPAYAPVIVPCEDFETGEASIIGVAVEVKRKLL